MGDNRNDIALEVQNVIVECSVVFQGIWLAGIVIDEIHDVAGTAGGPSLPYHLTILGDVVVGHAVDRGAGTLPLGAAGRLDLRHRF